MGESHKTIILRDLAVPLEEAVTPEPELLRQAARRLQLSRTALSCLGILNRALDARRRPRYIFSVALSLEARIADRLVALDRAQLYEPPVRYRWVLRRPPDGPPPVVVGAGPGGLFAALTLAEAGWPPILIERGKKVELRARDVSRLYAHGILDTDSNVCFGEGGAGAFSDGKLYTRVGDVRVRRFMETLVGLGADPSILINSRPHIGTDRLVDLLKALRGRLTDLGTMLRFETRVEDFLLAEQRIIGLRLPGCDRLDAEHVVLATGHSARGVWERLDAAGVALEARPFAVGFRVEHPQGLIDEMRYGRYAGHPQLPPADYRLTYNEKIGERRGVYSFCMCPGGVVVVTPTLPGELCINGMSHASRAGRYANSALVVTVQESDFARAGHRGVFAGVELQRGIERAAYAAGGGDFVAPAMRLTDFVRGKPTASLGRSSYRRGLCAGDLRELYPTPIIAALQRALDSFEQKMPGFVSEAATLIGVETRTASPIRLPRGEELTARGVAGLYPCGEGMGYGGGISSAAVDGIRIAEKMLQRVGAVREEMVNHYLGE